MSRGRIAAVNSRKAPRGDDDDRSRRQLQAYELLLMHAAQHGANAILAMRYDANEVMQGVTEVLAYGTAVQVERIS